MAGSLNRLQITDYFPNAIAHLLRVSLSLRIFPHLLAPDWHVAWAVRLYVCAPIHEAGYLVFRERIPVSLIEVTQVCRRGRKLMIQWAVSVGFDAMAGSTMLHVQLSPFSEMVVAGKRWCAH